MIIDRDPGDEDERTDEEQLLARFTPMERAIYAKLLSSRRIAWDEVNSPWDLVWEEVKVRDE